MKINEKLCYMTLEHPSNLMYIVNTNEFTSLANPYASRLY